MKRSQKSILKQVENYFTGINDTIVSNTLSVSDFLSRCDIPNIFVKSGVDDPVLVSSEHLELKVDDFLFQLDKVILYV